jgi:outer membrane lipoprotein SlyB
MHIARPQPMLLAAAALLIAAALGGNAIPGVAYLGGFKAEPVPAAPPAPAAACARCGVIEAIRAVELRGDSRSMAWRITVRLDDGSVRALSQRAAPAFSVGDRVRIVDGAGLERA